MENTIDMFKSYDFIHEVTLKEMNLGSGTAEIILDAKKSCSSRL